MQTENENAVFDECGVMEHQSTVDNSYSRISNKQTV